jgi:glutathionyl-hydroquinone reductase
MPLVLDPEPGRYLVYGAITCPFTHRVLLARALRRLEDEIPVALARPIPGAGGWEFDPPGGEHAEPLFGAETLRDVYRAGDSAFAGRPSVPMLWDRKGGRPVGQDSRAIALALNAHPAARGNDLYPAAQAARIDADISGFDQDFVRAIIAAGAARAQADYEASVASVFAWLDRLDQRLAGQRYLGGATTTDLADLVVFTGLVRFDTCYYFGSRCHLRRIQDYQHLFPYVRDIYQLPGVAATVDLDAYRQSYFATGPAARDGVIPLVPLVDLGRPHERTTL